MPVRQAAPSDLEDLTQILIASFDDDPCYRYRFPYKDDYILEYEEHCRRKCAEYLRTDKVIVYEVAGPRHEKKVVAFSVWQQPKLRRPKTERSQTWPRWRILPSGGKADENNQAQQTDRSQQHRQCNNPPRPIQLTRTLSQPKPFAREDRCRAFRDESKIAQETLLDQRFTEGYMFLKILLCHPNYRRRGAATALVNWGLSVGRLHGVVDTALFSSPLGQFLYHKLGFQEIGRFVVQVDGDDEKLDIPAMVYRAPSPPRSRRGSRCAAEAGGTPNGLRKCATNNSMVVYTG